MRTWRAIAWLGLIAAACPLTIARAQEPSIASVSPAAVVPGNTANIVINGDNLVGAKQLWTSFPCSVTLAADVPENGTKKNQTTFQINVPPETPVGIYAVRVKSDVGVSPLRFLLVDDLASIAQQGGNNTPATAQQLPGPCGVDGTIANLTVQYFKFTAAEGQQLSFEVLARRMGTSLDPMLRLLDVRGRELAFSDDAPGLCGDAQIHYTFKAAGDYLLELRDIRYQGGVYRLRVGHFPCVNSVYPLATQRGQPANLVEVGSSVAGLTPQAITAPAEADLAWMTFGQKFPNGTGSGFAVVELSDRPQFLETEPNNAPEQANRIELTKDVNGRFEQPSDVDRFIFTAKKDESYTFTGITRTLGSPSDLSFKILNKDGGQIAAVDDTGSEEGILTAKFPADGDYTLVVEELTKRGNSSQVYRVAIAPTSPGFSLTVSTDTFNVPRNGAISATVTATRRDYAGPIELSVAGLPAGFVASSSVIGVGRNDAVLTITAPTDATTELVQLVRVVGTAATTPALTAQASFATALKPKFANMRYVPPHLTDKIALSPTTASGFRIGMATPEVVFGQNLTGKAKLTLQRSDDLNEAVTLALLPPQNGVPAGITPTLKNFEANANEVELVVAANDKVALGDYTIAVLATLKHKDKTHTQPLAVRLKIAPPLTVASAVNEVKFAAGAESMLVVKVERNPALAGPVELALQNLPKGVTAAVATIAADQSETIVKLTSTADAAKGAIGNVTVKGIVTQGNSKFEATSGNINLVVE